MGHRWMCCVHGGRGSELGSAVPARKAAAVVGKTLVAAVAQKVSQLDAELAAGLAKSLAAPLVAD